jgi:ribosomal protein L37AE/L43A
MIEIKTTYPKRWVSINGRYNCQCGHKFYRENRDWFTINPFNKKSPEECRSSLIKEMAEKKRNCPKCGNQVIPKPNT